MGKSCSRDGQIPSSGLGGDSLMDRWNLMDRWKNNVALAHPFHVGKSCSKFGLGEDNMMVGQTEVFTISQSLKCGDKYMYI